MTWIHWVSAAMLYSLPALFTWFVCSMELYRGGADPETRTSGARGMLLAPVWPLGVLLLLAWLVRVLWIKRRHRVYASEIRKGKRREFWEAVRGTTKGR